MSGLKNITCKTSGATAPVTPQTFADNVESLGKSMGIDETCVKESKFAARQNASSAKASVGPFGMFGSGQSASSSSSLDNAFRERGCGNMLLDSKTVLNAASRMNCTLNSTAAETSAATNASSTVEITVSEKASLALGARMDKMIDRLQSRIDAMWMIDLPLERVEMAVAHMQDNMDDLISAKGDIGVLDITGSTIRAKAGVKLKVVASASADMKKKIEDDYKVITAAAAENASAQALGTSATQAATKAIITQKVENRIDEVRNDINTTLSESKVSVSASGKVKLTAPKTIKLTNTTVEASVAVDMMVSSMAGNAMDLGRTIGNEVASELASSNVSEQTTEGVDTVQDSMNEAMDSTVSKGLEGWMDKLSKNAGGLLVVAVACAMLLGLVIVVKKQMKKGSNEAQQQYYQQF